MLVVPCPAWSWRGRGRCGATSRGLGSSEARKTTSPTSFCPVSLSSLYYALMGYLDTAMATNLALYSFLYSRNLHPILFYWIYILLSKNIYFFSIKCTMKTKMIIFKFSKIEILRHLDIQIVVEKRRNVVIGYYIQNYTTCLFLIKLIRIRPAK